jgi:cytoskeletal protein CcmA (bactofilin family)
MARTRTGAGGEAVIGSTTRVRGRVSGDGDLRLEGTVEGDISLRGDLTITDGARAASNVEAQTVTVGGELEGDVRAQGTVRMEAGARVRGDMYAESVAIDEGAEFNGRLNVEFELPAELGGSATTGGRRR